jgi:hypothetical protein
VIDGWSLGLKLLVPCSEHGMVVVQTSPVKQDCGRKARGAKGRPAGL